MQNEAAVHVDPLVFWQCACGGPVLSERDCEHVMGCVACETLADGIKEGLDTIIEEKCGGHSRQNIS